jgi:hypothetical protein
MDGRPSKRRWTRLSIVLALTFAGVTALSAAEPAASVAEQEDCLVTLILEQVDVLQDTDPNAAWPRVDQWTYHIYWKRQNGTVLAKAQNYQFAGDTGYSRTTNTSGDGDNIVANAIPAGTVGAPLTLKLELWTKEKDPKTNRRGAFPPDARNNQNPFLDERTWTCVPGAEDRFSVTVDVPRSTADAQLAETDGSVAYHWLWRAT